MATQNTFLNFTLEVKEDLDANGYQFSAVALSDGLLANNGSEAIGILQSKPGANRFGEISYLGVMKYKAGTAAHTKDAKLTVTTSGWLKMAGSGDYIIGRALDAVTSGSIGRGLLNFTMAPYAFSSSFVA